LCCWIKQQSQVKKVKERRERELMAYQKRSTSEIVDNAKKKLASMMKIDEQQGEPVNYGSKQDPLTVTELTAKLAEYDSTMKEYNDAIDAATAVQNRVAVIENELNDMNKRILRSAAGKFTDDSDEYDMLGGTRASERKKPGRKQNTPST
jgi:Holliday junction resolvasome RuvABC ATP-dependent DNA helicase subunit